MSNQKAFTLIEMMVALVIVAILSSFVIVQMNSSINASKDVKRKADIELLASAIVSYSADHYSSKPIADTCTIGNDCDSAIEDALKVYLPTLPVDPNSDTYYSYQSNGNDCIVSATLSDNTVYLYSCATKGFAIGAPTAGVCGSAETTYLPVESAFSGDYCSQGTVASEPTFPEQGELVSWDCLGEYSGPATTCTAYHGKDGVCGDVTRTTITAYLPTDTSWPSSNYCFVGTTSPDPVFPLEGESTTWTCPAVYIGENATCTAYRGKDGVCGSSSIDPNDNFYLSSEITNPCSAGTVSTITTTLPATDYFKWTCSGIYTGSSSSQCTADLKVNGACGSANGGYYTTVPAANLRCANSTTPSNTTNWTWYCIGLNGGTDSGTCTAYQKQPCSYYGGTMTTCGGNSCCQMPLASCPSGWSYSGYNTTYSTIDASYCYISIGSACTHYSGYPQVYTYNWLQGCPSPTGLCYCTGSHSVLSNSGNEYVREYNECGPYTQYHYATVTSVGCY